LAEKILDHLNVLVDLLNKLRPRIQPTQTVIIRLSEELHTTRLRQGVKSADNFGTILVKLLQQYARYAVSYPELSVETPDYFKE
jgi:nitrate reductase assembly molybdenum cofactor insertion protein NarJ